MNPSNEQIRHYIFMRHKLGDTATQIHDQFLQVYQDNVPSYSSITNWIRQLRSGRDHLEDCARSGRSSETVNEQSIEKVRSTILDDRHVSICELSEVCDVPKTTVHRIIHDHLGMEKLCSRWIPHLLTDAQKVQRVNTSHQVLELLMRRRLTDVVTGDESWFYFYQTANKSSNMVWLADGDP